MKPLTAENLPEIERMNVDAEAMSTFTNEGDFMGIAIDLMIETGSYTCLAATTFHEEHAWDRDLAAVCGNMVRLYKLVDAVLDQTTQLRQETVFIFARLVFETVVNIRFIVQNYEPALIESYIQHSFRHERKLRDRIVSRIEARRGIVLPVEDRMLKSIDRSAAASGIAIEEVDLSDKSPWGRKNTFEKAREVGLEEAYLGAFGGPSHSVHGNWNDIYGNNLHWDEETGFTPNLDWHRPRPQVMFALCHLIAETLPIYFEFMGGDEVVEVLNDPLSDLLDRIIQASNTHEAYLGEKAWPEI